MGDCMKKKKKKSRKMKWLIALVIGIVIYVAIGMLTPAQVETPTTKWDGKGVTVTWDSAKDADGYYIYRAGGPDDTGFKEFEKIDSTEDCTYTDTTVTGGSTYKYYVVAYHHVAGNQNRTGVASSTVTQSTKKAAITE